MFELCDCCSMTFLFLCLSRVSGAADASAVRSRETPQTHGIRTLHETVWYSVGSPFWTTSTLPMRDEADERTSDQVGPAQQAISASAGSIVTTLTSTPLEVLKVRQQQAIGQPDSRALLVRIARAEGVGALWSGLRPTLLMSIPSTVLYLTIYEAARDEMAGPQWPFGREWAPLVAGGLSRLVASSFVSPLELLRTRMQAAGGSASAGMSANARDIVRQGGVAALWGGLVPTLWRDVPFSCMYWLWYEALKQRAASAHPSGEVTIAASFAAGATAGMAAAAATTPLDVVKTRQQLSVAAGSSEGTAQALVRIVRQEGWTALFSGLGPRLAKVAPSCAIMIASYELGKKLLRRQAADVPLPLTSPRVGASSPAALATTPGAALEAHLAQQLIGSSHMSALAPSDLRRWSSHASGHPADGMVVPELDGEATEYPHGYMSSCVFR